MPQRCHREQIADLLADRAVAVRQFGAHRVECLGVRRRGDPAVRVQPQALRVDVVLRDVRVDRQLDPNLHRFGFDVLVVRLRSGPFERGDRLADQPHVQVETDAGDVPGLLRAENRTGAADLEIPHRHREAGTQRGVLRDGGQTIVRGLGERLVRGIEEIGVAAFPPPADPAAQLVHLGQAEDLRPVDDQRVGIGDVQARLDDRGADEHVVLALPEPVDHLLQHVLVHLAVRHGDPGLRHGLAQPLRHGLDVLDPVVHVEDLTLAEQLTPDRCRDQLVVIGADVGEDRVPVLRWGGDGGHLADPGEAHLQGARDRRGGHGEHVDVRAQGGDVLLVLDPETLFLVHDHQAEVLVSHGGLQ